MSLSSKLWNFSVCLNISTTLPSETASSPPTITQVDHFWAVRRTMEGDSPISLSRASCRVKTRSSQKLVSVILPLLPSSIYQLQTLQVYVESNCSSWSDILQDILTWNWIAKLCCRRFIQDMCLNLARFGPRSCGAHASMRGRPT